MMGLRAADFIFRAAMGLIVIGWIAWMMMVQAEYSAVQKAVKDQPSSKPTQTFVHEPMIRHDPQMYTVDPYSRPMDDAVGDNPRPTANDWGN